jgi:hypothetical protein
MTSAAIMANNPKLPDSNPKTRYGIAKPGTHAIPPSAIIHLGAAMENGRGKYGLFNWRDDPVTGSVYFNAASRHMLDYQDGHDVDPGGSGCHPLAHVMACCAIILDAELQGTLNDDRGTPGRISELIARLTKPLLPETGPIVPNMGSLTVNA